jgi:methylenetetrahydrofolate dehydrogenase (NADP+) / methenyltetrahydrofolate cyclohydrolase
MPATLIDGKAFAAHVRAQVAAEVARLKAQHGLIPGLAVVLVGDDPASQVYVRSKGKVTRDAGMNSFEHLLPANTTQNELLALLAKLNDDPAIHGILVQLPLPKPLDPNAVIEAIRPDKDVDGLHPINAGLLTAGRPALVPCTPLGCTMLLKHHLGDLAGKHAVVVGRSLLVGKPMAQLLLQENCTVTIAHSKTVDLPSECRRADILVAAIGRPEMIRGDWVKPGACVIDVGINRVPTPDGKGRLIGDVKFDEAIQVAALITPVPGGVGPMTPACLLANTVTAARHQAGIH